MADITAIILTRNEENNIKDCISSVKNIVKRIIVIDSYSEDKTVEIAEEMGAEVIQHEFVNHAKQYIYAVDYSNITTDWILKIDADERLTDDSAREIEDICNKNRNSDISAIELRFLQYFMGKPLRHGGVYPWRKIAVYKRGYVEMEDRNMDEHLIVKKGRIVQAKKDSLHYGYKDLTFFVNKFNWYSTKEAIEYFSENCNSHEEKNRALKTIIKEKVYYKLPLGFRSYLYYCYRYYFRLGFLDGKVGKIYAFLHAYWYRFLIDAKIYEHIETNNELKNVGALK